MKLLRHFPAGFGLRTRCCKQKKGETAMFVLLRIKNRPTRQKWPKTIDSAPEDDQVIKFKKRQPTERYTYRKSRYNENQIKKTSCNLREIFLIMFTYPVPRGSLM